MVSSPVEYRITDTERDDVNARSLQVEIGADPSIVGAVDYVSTSDGDPSAIGSLRIFFFEDITDSERLALDDIVAAHSAAAEPSAPVAADGSPVVTIAGPKHSDGSSMFTPSQFPVGMPMIFPGVGDDLASGTRFDDTQPNGIQSTVAEIKTITTRYIEDIWLVGGVVHWTGATFGDWFDYALIAPPTDGVAVAVGSGSYAKIDAGPGGMWAPAGTPGAGSADWDLDLVETLNSNVAFTKAVPVPARDGFFDYSDGALTPNAARTGLWNLFDFELTLARLAPRILILGDGEINLRAASVPARCNRAQWKHVVTVHNSTAKTLSVVWSMQMARANAS